MKIQRSPLFPTGTVARTVILWLGLMVGTISVSHAQSGCYLINELGETIDLGDLCGLGQEGSLTPPPRNPSSSEEAPLPVPNAPASQADSDLAPPPEAPTDETLPPSEQANAPDTAPEATDPAAAPTETPPESAQAPETPEPIRRDSSVSSTESPQPTPREDLYRGYQDALRSGSLERKRTVRDALVEGGL